MAKCGGKKGGKKKGGKKKGCGGGRKAVNNQHGAVI